MNRRPVVPGLFAQGSIRFKGVKAPDEVRDRKTGTVSELLSSFLPLQLDTEFSVFRGAKFVRNGFKLSSKLGIVPQPSSMTPEFRVLPVVASSCVPVGEGEVAVPP